MGDDAPSLAPVLLVSMPQMADPNFSRSVVLLASMARTVRSACPEPPDGEPASGCAPSRRCPFARCALFVGGPVEPTRVRVLLADKSLTRRHGGTKVYSPRRRTDCRTLSQPPDPAVRIVVGYAGWGAGQLDIELAESAWLMAPVQPDLIFSIPMGSMWETAIRRLGAEPSALQGSSGVH
jgi:putative transcriptional regulator